ncbi:MAG TPA: MmgE/PrpD family protein [Methylomirabilota bacterium]|jgi:2-methylcitrate dehydratase PrpD|nr:MmgE/PrpD family protein [Methylomirabilota bacterium]
MSRLDGPGAALLRLVAAASLDDLPRPALESARLAVLDWWGVTVAGATEPVAELVRAASPAPAGPASVLGTDRSAPPLAAALWNGTAAHALDFDDVTLALPGHLTAPLLPGMLALAEARRLSGRSLLTAFVAGAEVTGRLARALGRGHYRAGWHATATLGRLGAAAGCGRLLGLDAAGIDRAVGLAAAQLGGIQESFGTMAKPFQVGRAAADGLLAALLAEAGATGPAGLLDRAEWARRLSPEWSPERLARGLGAEWEIAGIIFKRYPCCFATHAAIAAVLDLVPCPDPDAVESVELAVCPTALQIADQRAPRTGLAGKFSVSYCVASALLRGHVRETDFADAAVRAPALQAVAARVRLEARPEFDETRARAVVRLRDGTVREAAADLRASLDPARVRRELGEKFRALVAPRLGPAAGRLEAQLGAVDELPDMAGLARASVA